MSRKKPRSKDPHSWIKNTTKSAVEPEHAEGPEASAAADETAAEPEEEEASEPKAGRFVFVEYDTSDGHIIAMHEAMEEGRDRVGYVSAGGSEGRASARIALTGKLRDRTLADLHDNYKVAVSKTKPTLVPKG